MVLDLPHGVESLTNAELDEFLVERGLMPDELSRPQKVRWAQDWLQLATDPSIVPSVYLLFSACNVCTTIPSEPRQDSAHIV